MGPLGVQLFQTYGPKLLDLRNICLGVLDSLRDLNLVLGTFCNLEEWTCLFMNIIAPKKVFPKKIKIKKIK